MCYQGCYQIQKRAWHKPAVQGVSDGGSTLFSANTKRPVTHIPDNSRRHPMNAMNTRFWRLSPAKWLPILFLAVAANAADPASVGALPPESGLVVDGDVGEWRGGWREAALVPGWAPAYTFAYAFRSNDAALYGAVKVRDLHAGESGRAAAAVSDAVIMSVGQIRMRVLRSTGTPEIRPAGTPSAGVEVAVRETAEGWSVEFRLPWNVIGRTPPRAGETTDAGLEVVWSDDGGKVAARLPEALAIHFGMHTMGPPIEFRLPDPDAKWVMVAVFESGGPLVRTLQPIQRPAAEIGMMLDIIA